jgi:hypothetical protein
MSSANFAERFAPHLGTTRRWQAFVFIADTLAELRRPIGIVETGCLRQPDNWAGDGQSTVVWDWLVKQHGGYGHSYDISAESVAAARSSVSTMQVHQQDSVEALAGFASASTIDLLYLDSYDWTAGSDASAQHHRKELEAIYDRLRPGCLIAVDDCMGKSEGKHALVLPWLAERGVEPIVTGYVYVWRKPPATA